MVKKLALWLQGYKTYIFTIVTGVYNFAVAENWISHHWQVQVNAVLASAIVVALRAGIAKLKV